MKTEVLKRLNEIKRTKNEFPFLEKDLELYMDKIQDLFKNNSLSNEQIEAAISISLSKLYCCMESYYFNFVNFGNDKEMIFDLIDDQVKILKNNIKNFKKDT